MSIEWKLVNELTTTSPAITDTTLSSEVWNPTILKRTTWQSIYNLFKSLLDTAYDSVFVKLTWNQAIAGNKTFTGILRWGYLVTDDQLIRASDTDNDDLIINYSSGRLDWSLWATQFRWVRVYDWKQWEIFRINWQTRDITWNWQNWTSAWTSYTPTVVFGTSTGISVIFARYKQIGKTCTVNFQINISTPDTSISEWIISLPISWPFYQSSWSVSLNDWWVFVNATWWDIDWTNFKVVKIWANFSWFLVIRGSATYETN
jgi:hypothetical protein